MSRRTTQKDLLDGIKENIKLTERRITYSKRDLALLPKDGASVERRAIHQQVSTLEDNLELLKARWMHAVGVQAPLEHSLAKPDDIHEENNHALITR
jgi:chloramphenicol 3-O-phosphotransferase